MRLHPMLSGLSLTLLLALSACGASAPRSISRADRTSSNTLSSSSFQLEVAESDIAVGRDRFTFGLLAANHPLSLRTARTAFYLVHGNSATVQQVVTAHFNNFVAGLPHTAENTGAEEIKGVYVSYPTFNHAGDWMVVAQFPSGGKMQVARQAFRVAAHTSAPAVGTRAPRTQNPTIYQMPVSRLDSGHPPDDMHRLSIAAAIAQHKPLVVLFSTPAFCVSRMCGPQTEIVESVEKQFRGRVNFVHIEVYKNANPADGYAPAMLQWHLLTEPWVFVVNSRGLIAARFEGPTSGTEIAAAIRKVL